MSKTNKNTGINISVKSFITAIVVIFALMVLTYGLTFVIPGGGIPFWKWTLSPILILGAEGNASLIAVIVFLLVIGGILLVLSSVVLTFLQDITMIIVAVIFLVAGIVAVVATGRGGNIPRTSLALDLLMWINNKILNIKRGVAHRQIHVYLAMPRILFYGNAV